MPRRRILLIDGDALVIAAFHASFSSNVQVVVATSHDEALLTLRGPSFDLLFCDAAIEHTKLRKFYTSLRELDASLLDRIVFVTSHPILHETRSFLDSLFNLRIAKPLERSHIRQLVASRLGPRI